MKRWYHRSAPELWSPLMESAFPDGSRSPAMILSARALLSSTLIQRSQQAYMKTIIKKPLIRPRLKQTTTADRQHIVPFYSTPGQEAKMDTSSS